MIQVREDLTRKSERYRRVPHRPLPDRAGVSGNTVLEGNEEILNARSLNLVRQRSVAAWMCVGLG